MRRGIRANPTLAVVDRERASVGAALSPTLSRTARGCLWVITRFRAACRYGPNGLATPEFESHGAATLDEARRNSCAAATRIPPFIALPFLRLQARFSQGDSHRIAPNRALEIVIFRIVQYLGAAPPYRTGASTPWGAHIAISRSVIRWMFNYAIALYFMISCPGMSENFTHWLIELVQKNNI